MNQSVLKVPPNATEAEQALLGSLMISNDLWEQVVTVLDANDFYQNAHRVIFSLMAELVSQNKPYDTVMLSENLESRHLLEQIGGLVYLGELAANAPTVSYINHYAQVIREKSLLRELLRVTHQIADEVYNPNGLNGHEVVQHAEKLIYDISENDAHTGNIKTMGHALAGAMARIDELYTTKQYMTGIATGFMQLDELTCGLQKGELIIVAARPSMGKTAFAMNIVEHAGTRQPKPVVVFSLEMPAESLAVRLLSSYGGIYSEKIKKGDLKPDEWVTLVESIPRLEKSTILIDDTSGISVAEIRAKLRRIVRERGELGLVMVDYLQLMSAPGNKEGRVSEVTEISRGLKGIAREFNVPVLALSQLNRGVERRESKRPLMADLRDSGAIEQDADVILFIYREDYQKEEGVQVTPISEAEIIIGKQRNGPTDVVKLGFEKRCTRFVNLMDERVNRY